MALHHGQPGAPFYPGSIIAVPIVQAPPPAPKRPLEQSEDESGPKAKKSRAKSKSTSEGSGESSSAFHVLEVPDLVSSAGSSRRGYNAKKRNEAAQIAAQNGVYAVRLHCISILIRANSYSFGSHDTRDW